MGFGVVYMDINEKMYFQKNRMRKAKGMMTNIEFTINILVQENYNAKDFVNNMLEEYRTLEKVKSISGTNSVNYFVMLYHYRQTSFSGDIFIILKFGPQKLHNYAIWLKPNESKNLIYYCHNKDISLIINDIDADAIIQFMITHTLMKQSGGRFEWR